MKSVESLINYTRESLSEKKLPTSIDFMLTGACELCCSFCYGPRHEMPTMKTEHVVALLDNFLKNGVKQVVFTGGEPVLIPDLPVILTETKKRGLTIVLSTNGLKLANDNDLFRQIVPIIDWLGLPLDGDTPEVNNIIMRRTPKIDHFRSVLKLMQRLSAEKQPKPKIKIGTVVAEPNAQHIIHIPDVLVEYGIKPQTWKLYQVSPSEYGQINYSQLKIDDDQFEAIFTKAKKRALELGIHNVIKYSNRTRAGKYLFINPLGEALIIDPKNNDYLSIGNLLNNLDDVLNNWQKYVDQGSLTANFEETYPNNS